MKTIDKCRCCGSGDLYAYLDLGQQPLANSYHKGEELPTYPLVVNLCLSCFHSQLSVVVEPSLMFKNYLYVSGTTKTFQDHCKALAEDAVGYLYIDNARVLDIACNDGTLLSYFRELGCNIQGVDPAENLREITKEKNIPVEVGYWGMNLAKKLGKFDIITGTNVFAHVDNVAEFLDACHKSLNDNGVVILEFPYCNKMISHVEFDTIYHEHVSYFLISPFAKLVHSRGYSINRIIQTPIHGGSIRFFLKKVSIRPESDHLALVVADPTEITKGLLKKETYVKFAEAVEKNKNDMKNKLAELQEQGYKTIGYGASAKGNTCLNHFEINLDYIVDDNPMKWGYLTPGRNIPICDPEIMREEKQNLAVIILSWNFGREIIDKIKKIRPGKIDDVCLFYVPSINTIRLYNDNEDLLKVISG